MYRFRFGFTLAETMIAVAIIGIIATLTIPTFIKNYNSRANFTKLLKMHHDLEQNLEFLKTENIYGGFFQSSLYTDDETKIKSFFTKYYKVKNDLSSIDGAPSFDYAAKLKDGSYIAMKKQAGYMDVFIDTNGDEPPNMDCEDRYQFHIYNKYNIDVVNIDAGASAESREGNGNTRENCVGLYINEGWDWSKIQEKL